MVLVQSGFETSLHGGTLNVDIVGLNLRSPTLLASGVLGYSVEYFQRLVEAGAGAVVTKSVGPQPRKGYGNPSVFQASCGTINALGLPNPGIDAFALEIRRAKDTLRAPVIVSVFGYSAAEYAKVARGAEAAGADAVELNVSCPHAKSTGSEIGSRPDVLREVVAKTKSSIGRPVIVKLSPNVTDVVELAQAAVDGGADALTAINTVRALAIDSETGSPVLSNVRGGLSGPAIKPIALRCVFDIYERVKKPIIGCGGVTSWRDAAEFLLAGASAVQVGTAIAENGPMVFSEINRGLDAYLTRKKIGNVKEIVGLAHKR